MTKAEGPDDTTLNESAKEASGGHGIVAGLGRAGTTWLHRQLEAEDQVFTPRQKDLRFFDRHFDRGIDWYLRHFAHSGESLVRVDVSHDYFFHPLAPTRIAETIPHARSIVVLREPMSWSWSIARREAVTRSRGATTAREVFNSNLGTLAVARFACYAQRWIDVLGDRVSFLLYDDLVSDADHFWRQAAAALGFTPTAHLDASRVNETRQPRVPGLYRFAAGAGAHLEARGRGRIVGTVKRSLVVERLLLKRSEKEFETLDDAEIEAIRQFFYPDVEALSRILGRDLLTLWGYR